MGVDQKTDLTNYPFILSGNPFAVENATVLQNAGRSGNLVHYTLMARNPTSGKWVPWTDETATDGTQYPRGICMATLSEAAIKAGDVLNVPIIVGGRCSIDSGQLVIENSKTLDTIINVPANFNTRCIEFLRMIGIFAEATVAIDHPVS